MLSFVLICFPFAALSHRLREVHHLIVVSRILNQSLSSKEEKKVSSTGTGILTHLSLSKCFAL